MRISRRIIYHLRQSQNHFWPELGLPTRKPPEPTFLARRSDQSEFRIRRILDYLPIRSLRPGREDCRRNFPPRTLTTDTSLVDTSACIHLLAVSAHSPSPKIPSSRILVALYETTQRRHMTFRMRNHSARPRRGIRPTAIPTAPANSNRRRPNPARAGRPLRYNCFTCVATPLLSRNRDDLRLSMPC